MEKKVKQSEFYQIGEIEVIYKNKVKASQRPMIKDSWDAYKLFLQKWNENKIELVEQFMVMYLNRANHVLLIHEISSGGMTGTVADPRIILAIALKIAAVNMILAHNHPSGNLTPSRADEELTQKIKEAGKYFDIKVLDHLILSSDGCYSFADEGIL
jgi:DNA repair protein RadC